MFYYNYYVFHKSLDESNSKTNKKWVDKSSDIYNRLIKSCLETNDIKMYSTHNEGDNKK